MTKAGTLDTPDTLDITGPAGDASPTESRSHSRYEVASVPAPAAAEAEGSAVSASHDVLFELHASTRCDACGAPIADDGDDGYELTGRGMYLWSRGGGEIRFEEAPLCASCASAIGMTALARWEIEEEEG